MDIKGFQSFSAVRDKKSGGGLYLGIRHGLYESVMVDSGSKASFVTVCLNGKDCSVRLILVYGPQENDSEDKDSFYHDISVQVELAYLNGDSIIMVGDLNAKLGYDEIPNDLHPMSNNGEQLFELCKQIIEKSVLDCFYLIRLGRVLYFHANWWGKAFYTMA